MSLTVTAFLTLALSEIRAAAAGDVVSAEDLDLALAMFNEVLDTLNANQRGIYAERYDDYTLTPNLSPHTIGSGGTFNVAARPESIEAAALNIGGSPNVFTPIDVIEYDGYSPLPVPGVTSTRPLAVYYQKAWPLGKLYFYPVPTTAYGVRLWTRTVLAAVVQSDTFDLPPGYQEMLRLTVAERCAPHLGLSVSPETARRAAEARALVWGNNDVIPSINTCDAGMPNADGDWFDYRTGSIQ